MARGPRRTSWHTLSDGALSIEARAVPLGSRGQPSFVGRRQQHARATASTAMRYVPQQSGDKAGLAAFQNRDYYYLLSITLNDAGESVVQLEKAAGGEAEVIASAPLETPLAQPIHLKIEARGRHYDFYYGSSPEAWTLLKENADGTILSTKVAGGFVGTYFGMYAYTANP